MKTLNTIFLILLLYSCTNEKNNFEIVGKIGNIPDGSILELIQNNDDLLTLIDTAIVNNGAFTFSGKLESTPSKMSVRFKDSKNYYGSCKLYVSNEKIKIIGNGIFPSSWTAISKYFEQQAYNQIRSFTKHFSVTSDSLKLIRAKNRNDKELRNRLKADIDSIKQLRYKEELKQVKKKPNSSAAVEMLYWIAKFDRSVDKQQIEFIIESLDEKYNNTLYAEGIKELLTEREIPGIGDKMVDFVAHDTLGVNHSLSDFKGKYILLDFWHLACGPCIAAHPETKTLHKNNKEILTIIGVNLFADEEKWKEKSRKEGISWVNLSDGKGKYAGACSKYGIIGFPTYVLIDPEGVIVEKWFGYGEGTFKRLEKHIENIKV